VGTRVGGRKQKEGNQPTPPPPTHRHMMDTWTWSHQHSVSSPHLPTHIIQQHPPPQRNIHCTLGPGGYVSRTCGTCGCGWEGQVTRDGGARGSYTIVPCLRSREGARKRCGWEGVRFNRSPPPSLLSLAPSPATVNIVSYSGILPTNYEQGKTRENLISPPNQPPNPRTPTLFGEKKKENIILDPIRPPSGTLPPLLSSPPCRAGYENLVLALLPCLLIPPPSPLPPARDIRQV
jgi:hypothetical protein